MKASKKVKLLEKIAKDWEEKKHPRQPKGQPNGGQFISQKNTLNNAKLNEEEVETEYAKLEKQLSLSVKWTAKKINSPEWQKENNAPPPPPPSLKELAAINSYTTWGYKPVNKYLRTGEIKTELTAYETKLDETQMIAFTRLVASGLAQLPSSNQTVYRGAVIKPRDLDKYKIGDFIQEPAFVSTSKEQNKAFPGNVFYVIHPLPTTSLGKDIAAISEIKREAEVLYPPGVKFQVLEKITSGSVEYADVTYKNLIILKEV